MKKQSLKWISLANGYIGDIITIVHDYITKGLRQVCTDGKVSENLLSFLKDKLLERYQSAIDDVGFLLSVERSITPMTLNHYLNDNLEKKVFARNVQAIFMLSLQFIVDRSAQIRYKQRKHSTVQRGK
jgi:hypothetical protein